MKFFAQTKFAMLFLLIISLISACSGGSDSNSGSAIDTQSNQPVSIISQNQGFLGTTVLLDGSNSNDPDGNSLRYQWSFVSLPENSQAMIESANSLYARFTPDLQGDYVVQLIVNDGTMNSTPATLTFTIGSNRQPVANTGTDKTTGMGSSILLDGSNSTDADGDPLTYQWQFISRPPSSEAIFNNANTINPRFYAALPGDYVIQLVVNDGQADSVAATITVTATASNTNPVANAGTDAAVNTGTPVSLNGAGSEDVDGDTLTYQWRFSNRPTGSIAILNDVNSATPGFTPDMDGSYIIELTVNDGTINSSPDNVVITSLTPVAGNTPPVANAGTDARIAVNITASLTGLNSTDADNDPLIYRWRFASVPTGSSALLLNAMTATPRFTPDVAGNYVIELIVNDGKVNSNPDTVTITAFDANTPPTANAGTDMTVMTNTVVKLNSSASRDANGDTLTYKWSLVQTATGSTATLNNTVTASPEFTPDKAGVYVAQLTVNDGNVDSNPDNVIITVTSPNTPPFANAGPNATFGIGSLVTLNGSSSRDADGDTLTYLWRITSKPASSSVTLNNTTSVTPNFTPDTAGNYVIQLIVNDGTEDSSADPVMITAILANTPPVAEAGADVSVLAGTTVFLDGSGSTDANFDSLTFQWRFVSVPNGSTAALSSPTASQLSFTPDLFGDYVVQLIVNDSTNDSQPDIVTVSTTVLCSSKKSVFQQTAWPVLNAKCISCHQVGGVTSPLNFVDNTVAGFNDINFNIFKTISAKKDANNISVMLSKAANTNSDHGGGQRITTSSADYATLAKMVAPLDTCLDEATNQQGVMQNSPYQRLRKDTLALAGRLPTTAEENQVNAATTEAELEAAFDTILDQVLTENAFYDRLKEIYNDLLLTNKYRSTDALRNFDLSNFNNEQYFDTNNLDARGYSTSVRDQIRSNANKGLAQAPLELVAHVVRLNRPFTEILTANYLLVNPYSAKLMDLNFSDGFEFNYQESITNHNPDTFREAVVIDNNGRTNPHAGILTTLAFLTRYPSTKTNRNRARSRYVFKFFMDTDVEGLADRAGLDFDNIIGQVPTLEDQQCTQCHNVIDPVAGTFKNWEEKGPYRGNYNNWYSTRNPQEMLPPGFSNQAVDILPQAQSGRALQWLAGRIVSDNRFALSTIKTLFLGLTGRLPVQSETVEIENLKTAFVNNNFNLKTLVKDIVNSATFRASNLAATENPNLFTDVGTGRLLTPEQLERKIQAITGGYRWRSPSGRTLTDTDTYLILYGGINSFDVKTRITDPNVVMRSIQERIAFQTSCEVIPGDFNLSANNRVLLPFVELADTPNSAAGIANIKQNIQYLHKQVLGEELAINDPEITRTFDLFSSVWNVTTGNNIPPACRGGLSSSNSVSVDAAFTVRSWMAVMSYLLNDYRFLYE